VHLKDVREMLVILTPEGVQWGICTPKPKLLNTRLNKVLEFYLENCKILRRLFRFNGPTASPKTEILAQRCPTLSPIATCGDKHNFSNFMFFAIFKILNNMCKKGL